MSVLNAHILKLMDEHVREIIWDFFINKMSFDRTEAPSVGATFPGLSSSRSFQSVVHWSVFVWILLLWIFFPEKSSQTIELKLLDGHWDMIKVFTNDINPLFGENFPFEKEIQLEQQKLPPAQSDLEDFRDYICGVFEGCLFWRKTNRTMKRSTSIWPCCQWTTDVLMTQRNGLIKQYRLIHILFIS